MHWARRQGQKHNQYAKNEHNLSAIEYDRFKYMNMTYTAKFGFPFLCVVAGLSSHDILRISEHRIANLFKTEFFIAISQLEELTFLRMQKIFGDTELQQPSFFTITRDNCKY